MKTINSEVHMWANDDGDSFYAKEGSPERIAAMSAAETAYKAGNVEGADEALRALDYSDAEILQFHENWDGEDSQEKDFFSEADRQANSEDRLYEVVNDNFIDSIKEDFVPPTIENDPAYGEPMEEIDSSAKRSKNMKTIKSSVEADLYKIGRFWTFPSPFWKDSVEISKDSDGVVTFDLGQDVDEEAYTTLLKSVGYTDFISGEEHGGWSDSGNIILLKTDDDVETIKSKINPIIDRLSPLFELLDADDEEVAEAIANSDYSKDFKSLVKKDYGDKFKGYNSSLKSFLKKWGLNGYNITTKDLKEGLSVLKNINNYILEKNQNGVLLSISKEPLRNLSYPAKRVVTGYLCLGEEQGGKIYMTEEGYHYYNSVNPAWENPLGRLEQLPEFISEAENYISENSSNIQSSTHLNQHRGAANLALYYTPEEIEALQPDEHGVPTRSYEEAGWDPGVPTSLQDTEDVFPEDFDENAFDLTNPSMDLFLSDLESAIKKEDYAEALECLHDIGYSSEDAADLVDDFKYGVITPKDLFSAARLTAFLKSASSIRLIQNAGTVQVTADKINPVKVTSQVLSFASENVDLERLNKIESCFNLDRGVSIEIPSSNPDFMKVVQCFSSTKLQPRPVLQDASFKIKSSCTRASVASLTKAFNLPDSMNQIYSRAYIKEVNF